MIFPRLREGGFYVLEDWSSDHRMERSMMMSLQDDHKGNVFKQISSSYPTDLQYSTPMSVLIFQLVIAANYRPDWISEIEVSVDYCEVRRGLGNIPLGTPLAQYLGPLGEGGLSSPY